MSQHLEIELGNLKKLLLSLSGFIERTLQQAVKALSHVDAKLAIEVIKADEKIDQQEVEIEEECLKILALHQPVAIDLRFIIGVLKMNNDLERIGDLAVNISQRTIFLSKAIPINAPFDLNTMAQKTRLMLHNAIQSLITMDTALAKKVCEQDNEVDQMNREMYTQIFAAIKKNPSHVESLIQYISASRHLERIADYTTNIAEDVIYMVDGEIVRHWPEL